MGKIRVEFASVVEYLESEIKVEVCWRLINEMMHLGEALGLAFVWEIDGVRFEEGGVTLAWWWCDGWLVKGSMTTSTTAKVRQTVEIKGRNEEGRNRVG